MESNLWVSRCKRMGHGSVPVPSGEGRMASRLVGLCGLRDCVDKKEQQMLPAAVNNMLFLGVF